MRSSRIDKYSHAIAGSSHSRSVIVHMQFSLQVNWPLLSVVNRFSFGL